MKRRPIRKRLPRGVSRFTMRGRGLKLFPGVRRIAGKQYQRMQSGCTIICPSGHQDFADVPLSVNQDNGLPVKALVCSYDVLNMEDVVRRVLLLPNTVSQPGMSSATLGVQSQRWCVHWVKSKITFKNQTTSPVHVVLYDCVAKRDGSIGPAESFIHMQDTEYFSALDSTPTTAITNDKVYTPGVTPLSSRSFTQRWRLAKQTRRILQPGEEHVHTVFLNMNWWVNRPLDFENNFYRAGRSYALLAVLRGSMTHDSSVAHGSILDAAPNAVTESVDYKVTYGSARLDAITETTYCFAGYFKNMTQRTTLAVLPTVPAANQAAVDDEPAQVVANVMA